jgi:hypothetical protein
VVVENAELDVLLSAVRVIALVFVELIALQFAILFVRVNVLHPVVLIALDRVTQRVTPDVEIAVWGIAGRIIPKRYMIFKGIYNG